ncbi:hypothetical protein AAD001_13020 [Colwelliaceae bacterium 6471]
MIATSKIPFYRQFTRNFVAMFMIIALVFLSLYALIYQSNVQIEKFSAKQLPKIEKNAKIQQLIFDNDKLFTAIFSATTATEFKIQQEILSKNLAVLRNLVTPRSTTLEKIIAEHGNIDQELARFSRNSARNVQLKQSSIIQLQLVLDSIVQIISDKEIQQQRLFKQIANDRVNDRVTATRARAHATLVDELLRYRQVQQLLASVLADFKTLTIQTSASSFDQTSESVDSIFALLKSLLDGKNSDLEEFPQQVETLEQLLFNEHRTLSKWRGHLRLAQQYLALITEQQQALSALTLAKTVEIDSHSPWTKNLNHWLNNNGEQITDKHIQYALMTFALLLIFIFGFQVIKLRNKLKAYGEQSIKMCRDIIDPTIEQPPLIRSSEQLAIANIVTQLQTPLHSEADYQEMLAQHHQQLAVLAEHIQVCYWQASSAHGVIGVKHFHKILARSDHANKILTSWRRYFDRKSVVEIIACARKAKTERQFQSLVVTSVEQRSLKLTINYGDAWFGTLSDNSLVADLNQQIVALGEQLEVAQKNIPAQALLFTEQLNTMLVKTSLHCQSNIADVNAQTSLVFRQLIKMQDWCQQITTIAELQSEEQPLTLVDVDFNDVLHAALFNAMAEANQQRNQILLSNDPQLLSMVKLDVDLFQQAIVAICRLLLAEQYKANLVLSLQVIDKNSGQQLIRFKGKVHTLKKLEQLPQALSYLLMEDRDEHLEIPVLLRYLETLFSTLHASNLAAELNEQGFQFQLDLPLALAQQADVNAIDLKQMNVLLISTEQATQDIINNGIKSANGLVENLSKPELFSRQLSVKHLNRKKVDIVIVAADCFVTSIDTITQHINSLPVGLQPKVFILQPYFNGQLHQYGLYSQAATPLCSNAFLTALQSLHIGNARTNIVIDKDECKKRQCLPVHVEVLFACEHPSKHEALLRVLTWLGLQVHIVTHEETMLNFWRSGRYLVLFSEFKSSPFVELLVGQAIQRGVLTFEQSPFKGLSQQEERIMANWNVAKVPEITEIALLVERLSPWLKPKPKLIKKAVKVATENAAGAVVSMAQEVDTHNVGEQVLDNAFDLKGFATHQGSAEMAALMLDEYTLDNEEQMQRLKAACSEHDIDKAHEALAQLKINAQIMVAEKMFDACIQTEEVLAEDITKLSQCLKPLTLVVAEVAEFADAI